MPLTRRVFLAFSAAALAGCARRTRAPAPGPALPRLARVRVSPDRVIRTIAGLRPFRPSGFVVQAEKLGDKTVIHNYGHGGAGITLSWGTAHLAVAEAEKTGLRDCAVIGCGVVGLATARLLQERGFAPVIYAKDTPPNTTSNVAGGLWSPATLYEPQRITPEFRRQFVEASRLAHRRYQSMIGDLYGVRWLAQYSLSVRPFAELPKTDPASDIEDLYPERRPLQPGENPFDVPYARRWSTMLIEPAVYLNALQRDFLLNGGRIVIRNFAAAGELGQLRESLIFNCTGLGARALFDDRELTPVKGQLTFLLPQPEVDYCTVGPGDIYMFPRRDGILLGGSHERDVWTTDPDPATSERILRENAALFDSMRV